MREHVKGLVNVLVNHHFKFESNNDTKEKKTLCEKVNNDVMTRLLDLCDREWNHVGHEKQFMFLKKQLFHKLIHLVIQVYIELLEIINYFSWHSKVGTERKTRSTLLKQP